MKTIITTSALVVALCAVTGATARMQYAVSAPEVDTVLISETVEGNYLVRKIAVKRQAATDYTVNYQLDLAKLSKSLDNNSKELTELNMFVENLIADSSVGVESITIVGYSSPDGPVALNETLAKNRAMDFKTYVDKKYEFSKKFNVKTSWVAEDWEMCRELVAQSTMPDKQAVLNVIDGKWTPAEKETALKKMPAAWAYMKKNILPPLRRVQLAIDYGEGMVVETRMMIAQPQYVEILVAEPCCEVNEDFITGMIVETDSPGTDFKKDMRDADKMTKAELKAARREMRAAEKLAKKEARDAQKMLKAQAKAAQKMDKDQTKAARELSRM